MRASMVAALVLGLGLTAFSDAADVNLGEAEGVRYRADGSSADPAKLRVACPQGTHVASGGFGGGFNGAAPSVFKPFDDRDRGRAPDDGWQAVLVGGDGEGVGAYAVCKRGRLIYRRSRPPKRLLLPRQAGLVRADCPRGTYVIGGGAAARGAEIDSSYPFDMSDPGQLPDDAWRARVETDGGRARAEAFAVCQRSKPAYESVFEQRKQGSGSAIFVECPNGRPVIGGGLRLGGNHDDGDNDGGLHPDDQDNDDIPQDAYYTFSSNELDAAFPIPVTAFAICK